MPGILPCVDAEEKSSCHTVEPLSQPLGHIAARKPSLPSCISRDGVKSFHARPAAVRELSSKLRPLLAGVWVKEW